MVSAGSRNQFMSFSCKTSPLNVLQVSVRAGEESEVAREDAGAGS